MARFPRASPWEYVKILKNCLDGVNPGSGTTKQVSVFNIPAHDGIDGKMKYECTKTAEETYDVYDITLNGWMTSGEDEYVLKDCGLRIEGAIPVSQSGTCVKNGLPYDVHEAYKLFKSLMKDEKGYPDYNSQGTFKGQYDGSIYTGDIFVIWNDTETGKFTFYFSQDTNPAYTLLKFKATGSFSYDYIQNIMSFTEFNVEYAMEDASNTLPQETWYDVSYFNIDQLPAGQSPGVCDCPPVLTA